MPSRALLVSCALLLALPVSATAAGPSACVHVITDPAGDTDVSNSPAIGAEDINALDLVAVDVATSPSKVVFGFRVRQLAFKGVALDNRQWWALLSGRDHTFQLVVSADASGSTAMLTARGPAGMPDQEVITPPSTPVTLVFDEPTNTVRASAARTFFDSHGGLPRTITDFRATTSRAVGLAGPGEGHVTSVGNTTDAAGPGRYVTDSRNACLSA